jgi:hypothetical protein
MPLQRQTLHFPLAGGIDNRAGKLHSQPPQLSEMVNARWEKIGKIGKRHGFDRLGTSVTGGVTPAAWYKVVRYGSKTIAITDAGPFVLNEATGAWNPYNSGTQKLLFGISTVFAKLGTGINLTDIDIAIINAGTFGAPSYFVVAYLLPVSATSQIARIDVLDESGNLVSTNQETLSCALYNGQINLGVRISASYGGAAALACFGTTAWTGGHAYVGTVSTADLSTITFSTLTAIANFGTNQNPSSLGYGPGTYWDICPCDTGSGIHYDRGWALVFTTASGGVGMGSYSLGVARISAAVAVLTVTYPGNIAKIVGPVTAYKVPTSTNADDIGLVWAQDNTGGGLAFLNMAAVKQVDGTIDGTVALFGSGITGRGFVDGTIECGGAEVSPDGNNLAVVFGDFAMYGTPFSAPTAISLINPTTSAGSGNGIPCAASRPFWVSIAGTYYPMFLMTVDHSSGQLSNQPMYVVVPIPTTSVNGRSPDYDSPLGIASFGHEFGADPGTVHSLHAVANLAGKLIVAVPMVVEDVGSNLLGHFELINFNDSPPAGRTQQANGTVLIPNLDPLQISGQLLRSASPEFPTLPILTAETGSGLTPGGTYRYVAVLEWADSDGNIHRSAPSLPATITLGSVGGNYRVFVQAEMPLLPPFFGATQNAVLPSCAIVFYRTTNGGSVFYRLSIANPGQDAVGDAGLVANATIYTNGGVLENWAPLSTNILIQNRDRILYIPSESPSKVRSSKPFVASRGVEFHPEFEITMPKEITNGGTVNDTAVLMASGAIYRLDGDWPDATGNGHDPIIREIARGIGCVDAASCYETPIGLIFKCATSDTNGWMLLDLGFALQPIGAPVMDSNALQCVGGQVFGGRGEIWLFHSDGTVLIYDWIRQQWATHFIPLSVAGRGHPSASSISMADDLALVLGSDGSIMAESPTTYTDGLAGSPATQEVQTTITTGWYSFAGVAHFQRLYEIMLSGEYYSPHVLTVELMFDYNETVEETHSISVQADPNPYQVAVKPGRQRCQAVKIRITDGQLTGTGRGFALEDIAFSIGIVSGLAKKAKEQVV